MKGRVSKINQVKENVPKNDQLQCIRMAVYRFFFSNERSHLLDFKLAFVPDQFFIGGIVFWEYLFQLNVWLIKRKWTERGCE